MDEWRLKAACSPGDTRYFYGARGENRVMRKYRIRTAKEICGRCQVSDLCLKYAIENREEWGIWGGKTAYERDRIIGGLPPTARDVPKCGTPRGYRLHVRRHENPCSPCREARRQYDRARYWSAKRRHAKAPEDTVWRLPFDD